MTDREMMRAYLSEQTWNHDLMTSDPEAFEFPRRTFYGFRQRGDAGGSDGLPERVAALWRVAPINKRLT